MRFEIWAPGNGLIQDSGLLGCKTVPLGFAIMDLETLKFKAICPKRRELTYPHSITHHVPVLYNLKGKANFH